jgi:peptidoglycan/xylan/chitin deacetylase (PgdA/CDA1 family)
MGTQRHTHLALAGLLAGLLGIATSATSATPATAAAECPSGYVALTFDDGPDVHTPEVLDTLAALDLPGTFFVLGNNVDQRPSLVARTSSEGHLVANHSYSHADLELLTYEEIREEVLETDRAIREAGVTPLALVRPPYGHWDGPGGHVDSAVRSTGYQVVTWTYSPTDYTATSDVIRDRVLGNLHADANILLHDGSSNAPEMIAALPEIAEGAREAGYCFGVLDEDGDVVPAARGGFVDVAGSTHVDQIIRIAEAGITRGCNPPVNDRYCPTDPVTRQQMASFLTRALDLPSGTSDRFVDVAPDGTHAADVDAIAEAGITRGCNPPVNDRYCPTDPVTREQMASFLTRAGLAD